MRLEPITLRGSAVQLEPLSERHAQALLDAAADRSTFGFTLVPADLASMRARISGLLHNASNDTAMPFAQRRLADDAVVGCTRYLNMMWWAGRDAPVEVEIGGTFEGVLRNHRAAAGSESLLGTARNTATYSIIPAEWPAIRDRLIASLERWGNDGSRA